MPHLVSFFRINRVSIHVAAEIPEVDDDVQNVVVGESRPVRTNEFDHVDEIVSKKGFSGNQVLLGKRQRRESIDGSDSVAQATDLISQDGAILHHSMVSIHEGEGQIDHEISIISGLPTPQLIQRWNFSHDLIRGESDVPCNGVVKKRYFSARIKFISEVPGKDETKNSI